VDARSPTLLEPGQVYEYAIALQPTSIVFKDGHRIRVDVSSSDFPAYDRNHNTGLNDWEHPLLSVAHQVVFHDAARPSRVTLPIIPRP
jgi:putative CocE/NonD family hydrolase